MRAAIERVLPERSSGPLGNLCNLNSYSLHHRRVGRLDLSAPMWVKLDAQCLSRSRPLLELDIRGLALCSVKSIFSPVSGIMLYS